MPVLIRAAPDEGNRYAISFPYDKETIAKVKVPGAKWDPDRKLWTGTRDVIAWLQHNWPRAVRLEDPRPTRKPKLDERLSLYPYQEEGARFLLGRPDGGAIGDAPGVGKTRQMLAVAAARKKYKRVLVLYPAVARSVWRKEARLIGRHLLTCEGIKNRHLFDGEKKVDLPRSGLVGCHYEVLHGWGQQLALWKPQLIIADELHYLSNRNAQRAQAAFLIRRQAEEAYGCSGTLFYSSVRNLWSQVEFLRPGAFGGHWGAKSWSGKYVGYWRWAQKYCDVSIGEHGERDDSGASNIEELRERLGDIVLRREREDVLPDLPPLRREIIEITPPDAEYSVYIRQQKKFLVLAETQRGSERKDTMQELVRTADAMKLKHAAKLALEAAAAGEKVVVFTHFHESIRALKTIFDNVPDVFYAPGFADKSERRVQREAFRDHEGGAILLANTKSTGVAVDELSVASRIIFSCLEWVPSDLVQAESRGQRHGQVNGVLVQYLLCRGTVDLPMATAVFGREEVNRELFGEDPQAKAMAKDFDEAGFVDYDKLKPVAMSGSVMDEALDSMLSMVKGSKDSLIGGFETDFLLEEDE